MGAEYLTMAESTRSSTDRSTGSAWSVALDTGGTFTDVVARDPDGRLRHAKVPSDGTILATVFSCEGRCVEVVPASGLALPEGFLRGWRLADGTATVTSHAGRLVTLDREIAAVPGDPIRLIADTARIDAPRLGLHIVTGTPLEAALPPMELRLSTTRGTNALLEGRGARVGVLVSDGLSGVVTIGDQTREDLFARVPTRTRRTAHAVRALPERSLADGRVDAAASDGDVAELAAQLAHAGCDAIVVSLAHALTNGREQAMARTLRDRGFAATAARDIAPHPRLLTRTETACIHARIAPILEDFVTDATASIRGSGAFVFTSAGVLQRADRLLARDTLYSGPAGGARAVCAVAQRHGLARAVGFDMGGTSSDVTRTAGTDMALRSESRIAGMVVAAPSVAIDSVAAGGGSICAVRDGALEVGPRSAGANPGPACYGRGGPLTITDVNLLAGRMAAATEDADSGAMSLDGRLAAAALDAVMARSRAQGGGSALDSTTALLAGFLDIANARMALAIETLCVRDGVDPRGHALIAFGGAGGQHACAIADRLGIERIVFPRFAGFLCAHGVLEATPARFATRPLLAPLDQCATALHALRSEAVEEACAELARDGFASAAKVSVRVSLRLSGQESTIAVDEGTIEDMHARFDARFTELFGYTPPARAIEVVAIEVCAQAALAAAVPTAGLRDPTPIAATAGPIQGTVRSAPMLSEGEFGAARTHARVNLRPGDRITGPALVTDAGETVVLDASWCATVHASGDLLAERIRPVTARTSTAEQELFAARLEAIALAMGNVLERTALSPNIRDRLDFSCAVLDANGTLVQNAPHLPVHLGALGVCTRMVMAAVDLGEGDIAVTNHPAFGGSHLPDVTTVAPVFVDGARVAFVAVRAHHAEIGGTRPGSFPPDARSLAEEGVVLEPFVAVRAGSFAADDCRARFASGPHPSRNPDENLADLQAQIAATRHGVAQVGQLARECGGGVGFSLRCEAELDRADRALRRAVSGLAKGLRAAHRELDDGSRIAVSVQRIDAAHGTGLRISFAGSSDVHPANFNAPLAVTRAATLYVLRLLIDADVPMNEGLLRAVELDVPAGMLNPTFAADPTMCPPVVAGNVETSQSVVAALIDCLGLSAESQSTMNNTLFGNERFTIYETLGGGAGAGPGTHVAGPCTDGGGPCTDGGGPCTEGAGGVHVHMSNTRLTDIDVLERRAPVIIREFGIRSASGGVPEDPRGCRGGDGMVRSYEFTERASLSFFGSRRVHAPRGVPAGTGDARTGLQRIERSGVSVESHEPVLSLDMHPGDRFTVETPGGAAWSPTLPHGPLPADLNGAERAREG